jgi:transcriptional antiterminator RfaH
MTWKVLYVQSRREKQITKQILELGIEAYVPLKTEIKQWSDRKKKVITPLINGYVFIKPNQSQRDEVFNVEGILNYVRYNGNDAKVTDREIEILKMIEAKGYYVEFNKKIEINVGDVVEIKAGKFKGLAGVIEKLGKKEHCYVIIKSLDFQLKIKLEKDTLEKVK